MSRPRKSPPPALSGLIRQLPASAWSTDDRARFLEAFTRCLDLSIPMNDGIVLDEVDRWPDGIKMVESIVGPLAEWQRDVLRRLQDSGAHAPDPVDDTTTELGPLDDITYRSTGRGAYDVIRTRAEGPDTVLAMVQFTEGVRGRVHGLEALVRSLRQTTQDVRP